MRNFTKLLAYVFLICTSAVANSDDYVLYDGPTGAACRWYNQGADFKWKHYGGDWRDALGNAQGNVPLDTVSIKIRQRGTVQFDVTAAMTADGFVLRNIGGEGPVSFKARESGVPPRLIVKLDDQSTIVLSAIADTYIAYDHSAGKCYSYASVGKGKGVSTVGPIYIQFPPVPVNAISATLVMTIKTAYKDVTVGAFSFSAPRPPRQPVTTGFASQFPGDIGIERHRSVLYAESWTEQDRDAWWRKTFNHRPNLDRDVNWAQDGGRFPTTWYGDYRKESEGVNGEPGLLIHFPSHSQGWTKAPSFDVVKATGEEADELFVRYYVKFDEGFLNPPNCDGGKLPGLSGSTEVCAGSGGTPDGYCGWSLRMHFALMCDPGNPMYGKLRHAVYAYYPGKTIYWGETISSSDGGEHGNFKIGEWTCLEQRVKVNTPGIADGVLQTWINGRLGVDRKNFLLRKALDAEHPKYAVPGNLGITKFWGAFHFGGTLPLGGLLRLTGYDGNAWYDQVVVARERIGCMS